MPNKDCLLLYFHEDTELPKPAGDAVRFRLTVDVETDDRKTYELIRSRLRGSDGFLLPTHYGVHAEMANVLRTELIEREVDVESLKTQLATQKAAREQAEKELAEARKTFARLGFLLGDK